jgi:hypothetical protein
MTSTWNEGAVSGGEPLHRPGREHLKPDVRSGLASHSGCRSGAISCPCSTAALGSGCSPRMSRSQYSRAVLQTLGLYFSRFFADRLLSIQMSLATFSTSAGPLCQACQVALFVVCAPPVLQKEIPFSQRRYPSHIERYLSNTKRSLSLSNRNLLL